MKQVEPLESRRLLASVQVTGTFTGTEEHTADGHEASETIDVSAEPGKAGKTNVAFTLRDNIKSFSVVLEEVFTPTSSKTNSDLSATIPASIGSGTIDINGNVMSISGTLKTGIFFPLPFTFEGTKKKKPTVPVAPSAESIHAADATTATKANPAIGLFIGHLTRASDSVEFKTKANIRVNSKGHPALDLLLSDPGFGSIEIASAIHPTHTGSFTLALGSQAADGVLQGHITHTGRLVLELGVAGFSSLTGSQKRH